KVDAVVVGSGAAGSAIAAKLAVGGKQVVILEAGPERGNDDLVSSAIWSRRLKWGGDPVIEEGENPVGHVFNAGYCVGGAAMHHFAVWPRLHAEDFQSRSLYDEGADWPISYDDIRPYYDEVQEECGIAGDAEREIWRPPGAPYPMPGVPLFAQGEILASGFEKQGMSTAPLPLAVTSIEYKGRTPCIWDGWCDAGCPIGALANPLTIHLPIALKADAILAANSTVTRVLTNASGEYVTGVEYATETGEKKQVIADLVVMAAFSIQIPRLLLASSSDKHPHGLANSSGTVGQTIMTHPAALVYGIFAEQTQCYMGAFGGQLVNQDSYAKNTHAASGAFGSYQWMIANAVKPNDLLGISNTRPDLFGNDLHDFMKNSAQHFATMTGVIEDLPVAENKVTLSDQVDAHGTPLAKVTHTTHAKSKALWQAALEEGKAVFEAAGATEVWTGPQAGMHIIGGTVMGDDPQTSVTNSYGQCHDIANLVIAGSGLFPTSAGVNPTFTIHALTARAGDHLLANWGSIIP
ncbi:MAG: GMC family oxidoreductase, partial [Proteobacteria bacterium]|nr:GMC family oxidoreductase [Pseudomonadota bacterium]